MIKILSKLFTIIIKIIIIPIAIILSIPIALIKIRENQRSRLLYTGKEQSWLGKAQRAINMNENALLKPDRDLLIISECIEESRINYQLIKNRERFDETFTEYVIPRINMCSINDWDNVANFFDIPRKDLGLFDDLLAAMEHCKTTEEILSEIMQNQK